MGVRKKGEKILNKHTRGKIVVKGARGSFSSTAIRNDRKRGERAVNSRKAALEEPHLPG